MSVFSFIRGVVGIFGDEKLCQLRVQVNTFLEQPPIFLQKKIRGRKITLTTAESSYAGAERTEQLKSIVLS